MQTKKIDDSMYDLLMLAKSGDKAARDEVIEKNIGLVHSVVRRFLGRGYETEDLFQIGSIGLIKAVLKFDPDFDVRFSTYAVPMIMGEIRRFIRDDGIIKVSRSIKELAVKALALRENIIKSSNKEPSVGELAKGLGVSPEEVAIALDAGLHPESLNAPLNEGEEGGKTIADRIESKEDCEGKVINRILISKLLEMFDERERKIIILRYFKQKTQSQIAKLLGISQVQVSRIEKKVLGIMKKALEE